MHRSIALLALGNLLTWLSGCRCSTPTIGQNGEAEVNIQSGTELASPPPPVPGCVSDPETFTLRASRESTPEPAEVAAQPFAAEVGEAVVFHNQTWLPFLQTASRPVRVGSLSLEAPMGAPREKSFEAKDGADALPRLISRGEELLMVVPGRHQKQRGFAITQLSTGAELPFAWLQDPGAADDSLAYDLAVNQAGFALVWDTWDSKHQQDRLAGVFHTGELGKVAKLVEAKFLPLSSEAESPRLLARASGYWLLFRVRVKETTAKAGATHATGAPGGALDAPAKDSQDVVETETVQPSYLAAILLDKNGDPESKERAITSPQGYVQSFDIAASSAANSVLLTWLDAPGSVGGEGGRIHSSVLNELDFKAEQLPAATPPLHVTEQLLGTPSLTPGETAGSMLWLSFEGNDAGGNDSATWFAPLSPEGALLGAPRTDPAIGSGTLVASHAGKLLVAVPRGRDVVLRWVSCPIDVGRNTDAGVVARPEALDMEGN